MQLLVFSDLHFIPYKIMEELPHWDKSQFDAIAFLGDIDFSTLQWLNKTFHGIPMFGVLGNHDASGYLEAVGISNIHANRIKINGYSFVGMEGSLRYKQERGIMFSHEESLLLSVTMPKADILISHTSPYGIHERISDIAHKGLLGINKYIETHLPRLVLHGHQHEWQTSYMENKTKVVGVYGIALVDIDTLKIEKLVDLADYEKLIGLGRV